jgi:competence protein ComEC
LGPPFSRFREPLLLPAIGLAAGIFMCAQYPVEEQPLLVATAAFGGLLATCALLRQARRMVPVLACLTLATLGAARYSHAKTPVVEAESGEIVLIAGCVVDPPVLHSPGDRSRFLLELDHKAIAQVSLYIRDGDEPPPIRYGERIEFEGRIRAIRNFGNPGAFDFARYMGRRHIYWNVTARTDTRIERVGTCGNPIEAAIFRLRGAIEERIESLYPNDSYARAMMAGILIGQTSSLEREWTDEFRRTGTYHALVVSGMHFTSLAFLMLFGFRLVSAGPTTRLIAGLVTGWLYTALCGWSAPVVRAAGALTLFLIGQWMFRRIRLLNGLAAVAILYLLWDPGQLFEASFQLSFAAVAALSALAEPFLAGTSASYAGALKLIGKKGRDFRLTPAAAEFRVEVRLLAETISLWTRIPFEWVLRPITLLWRTAFATWDLLAVSFVMQIALTIPMAIYFHRVTWTGLTANLIVVPLMTVAVPTGLAAVATGWSVPADLAQWCVTTSSRIAWWHVRVADLHFERRIPDAPVWSFVGVLLALVFSALAFRLSQGRSRWLTFSIAALASIGLAVVDFPVSQRTGELTLTMIDVGQGDSILLDFPDGKRMLIDGGGLLQFGKRSQKARLDTGEDVVSPFLWRERIGKVDVIASTHAHEDHIGGLPALLENFRPSELWTGALPVQAGDSWKRVEETAKRLGIRIIPQRAGPVSAWGSAQIQVMAPLPGYEPAAAARNNDSLMLLIQYGQRRFLLTGDAERQVEAQLAAAGNLQSVDVLKAGHHGSRTSSTPEFLDAVQPRVALVSAGFENQFRHPHPAVLRTYAERGIQVLRTDVHGLIQVRTNGRTLEFHTPATTSDY